MYFSPAIKLVYGNLTIVISLVAVVVSVGSLVIFAIQDTDLDFTSPLNAPIPFGAILNTSFTVIFCSELPLEKVGST